MRPDVYSKLKPSSSSVCIAEWVRSRAAGSSVYHKSAGPGPKPGADAVNQSLSGVGKLGAASRQWVTDDDYCEM